MEAQARVQVECVIENRGSVAFETVAPHPVHLSYRWLDAVLDEPVAGSEGIRSGFQARLMPHVPLTLCAQIQAPSEPGDYILRLTAVQEHVAWFDDVDKGNAYEAFVRVTEQDAHLRAQPPWIGATA